MDRYPFPPKHILSILRKGVVIPAHPLALTADRKLDYTRQSAITRYYIAAGAGGIAIGVHTTQFEIHDPKIALYKPLLSLTSEVIDECSRKISRPIIKIAGICGSTNQAIQEAKLASDMGYHAGLLSLSALKNFSYDDLVLHSKKIAEFLPIFGFYLQPSIGGMILNFNFWRHFVEIENVVAIKIAPFNRYYTLDVIKAVAEAGRENEIALYTGNDDNIVNDLLTIFSLKIKGEEKRLRIVGGLLGQWAIWTKRAVELLEKIHAIIESNQQIPREILTLGAQITDANGAIFDAANNFSGCIPGIHEVLRRQGLLKGIWCLNPKETLSPGQMEEIDRVYLAYPHLNDDEFVSKHLDAWLSGKLF